MPVVTHTQRAKEAAMVAEFLAREGAQAKGPGSAQWAALGAAFAATVADAAADDARDAADEAHAGAPDATDAAIDYALADEADDYVNRAWQYAGEAKAAARKKSVAGESPAPPVRPPAASDKLSQGELLRKFRISRNLTQQALAAGLGIGQPIVSYLENGRVGVSRRMAAKIEERYGLPGEYFLEPFKTLDHSSPAKLLRSLRVRENLSQKQMAEVLGTTPAYIHLIERGRMHLRPDWARKIEEVYHISVRPDGPRA